METEMNSESMKELPLEIQKVLKNTDFPIEKNDIIEQECKRGAIPDILRELGMLPDKKYYSAEDVAKELHKLYIGVSA